MSSARPISLPLGATTRRPVPRPGSAGRPLPLLAAVAAVYTLAQLILVVPGMGLGWDETVYISQVDPHTPAAFFSAPRARGITFLISPVTVLTTSPQVIHAYLAVLSGGALYLSLRIWRPLLPVSVLALAGVLFGGLWITLLYGSLVMPNLWVAYGALLATGCFLRAVGNRGDLPALIGLGAGIAFAGLMRPADAVWLALPLGIAALSVRAWRRPAVLLVLVAAVALGSAEWVVDAYLRYGGLMARLHRASEIQGGMGWHPAFDYQLRALAGRTLCRPCDVPWQHPITAVWWFSLPLFTAGGLVAAARLRRTAVALVPTLTGLSLAVQYLLMIDYAAPRFLLPTYALLALPVALCLVLAVTWVRPRLRPLAAGCVGLALGAHLAVQYTVLHGVAHRSRVGAAAIERIGAELSRQGVRPPCVVSGYEAVRIAYQTGCASRQISGHDGSITRAGLVETASRVPVAVMVPRDRAAPPYVRGWREEPVPRHPGLRAYLSPSVRP